MYDATISFPILGENFKLNPTRYFEIGNFKFYWYGLIIAIGLTLAVIYALRSRNRFGLTEDNILDMLICAVPSAIVCARIYYVVFNYDLYRGNFLDVFKIWNGGIAIYGAVIGGMLAVVIFCKIKKISIGAMLDVGALGLLIGQAIGRWANFINREAYGASTNLPWKMGLTSGTKTIYVHPTFLYESLWNIIGFIILHHISKKHRKFDGQIFAMYIAWYGFGRFFIEGLRVDSLYLFGTGLRVSQILAIITFGIAVIFLLYMFMKRENRPEDLYMNRKAAGDNQAGADLQSDEEETAEEDEDGEEYEYIDIEEEMEEEAAEKDDKQE
ncbi:MAG: prolipoprotein diacylglyceryl transferase [Oscillospiraceae bacterium]